MSYQFFARYYDALTENVGYEKLADYIVRVFRRLRHPPGLVLDLACGTGSLMLELAGRGLDVFGLDASPDMLTVAQRKAEAAGFSFLLLCQKMQKLELCGPVDTVLYTLDGLNHLKSAGEVQETFLRVSHFLNPGGLFLFDVNTPYKHLHILAGQTFVYDTEDAYCVWQNGEAGKDSRVTVTLDFFGRDGENWKRSSERFQERAYSRETLIGMLDQAGLEVRSVWKDRTFVRPGPTAEKWFFAVRKKTEYPLSEKADNPAGA